MRALAMTIAVTFCLLVAGPAAAAGPPCVDMEKATVKQLQTLKAVGPAMAKRIVDHRRTKRAEATRGKKAKWNFQNWKRMYQVKGVTGAFCAKNRARVCFSGKVQKVCPKYTPPPRKK